MPQNRIWAKMHLSVLSCNSTTAYLIATSFSILESFWIGLYNKIKYNNFARGPYHLLSDLYSALNQNNAKIGKILKIGQLLAPITFFWKMGKVCCLLFLKALSFFFSKWYSTSTSLDLSRAKIFSNIKMDTFDFFKTFLSNRC